MFNAKLTIAALTAAAVLSLSAARAHAATRTVCASGCDYRSVRGAIDAAADGDVLALEPETFFEGDLLIDRNLTIRATSGLATIDADGASTVIEIDADATVMLQRLKLISASRAVVTNHGTADLKRVWVLGDGSTSIYGGIVNYAGAFLVLRGSSVVANNRTLGLGGGINNFGDLHVRHSTITGNQGRLGGGIFNSQGNVVVDATSISFNRATVRGGGYANANVNDGAVIVLPTSSYSGNTADDACDRYYDIHRTPACVD